MGLSVADQNGEDMTPLNDCYGSQTATLDVAMLRLIPPAGDNLRACAGNFAYIAGGTQHTLTAMVTVQTGKFAADAVSGQAVISLNKGFTSLDGTIMTANDYVSFLQEDGTYAYGKISSVSGLNVTLSANLAKNVNKGDPVWFHGAPGDHTDRQFYLLASTLITFNAGDLRVRMATASDKGTPILMHVDNITAAGKWLWQHYYYD